MIRNKRRWIWISLSIGLAILVGLLATSWGVTLVNHYYRMLEIARSSADREGAPWTTLMLGTIGFAVVIAGTLLFLIRLLKEMQLNQFQSEFLATVSHELKTPIAAIELSSSLIQAGGLSEEERKRLWAAHDHELKRLHEGVEALLEAARCQTAPTMLTKTPVVLEEWLTESLSRWARILGPQSVLKREGDPLNCKIAVDLRLLNLITNNLLDNSRKFAVDQPKVFIYTKKGPEGWQIQFQDEGWGFDPSTAKRLFTRFFRGSNTITHSIPGTGLGLYLAANASQAMGLKLRAESSGVGKGARFTLEGRVS